MSHPLITLYTLAGLLTVTPAAPVPKSRAVQFEYPTRAGTKWEFRMTYGGAEKTLAYVAEDGKATVEGRKAVRLRLDDPQWMSGGTVEVADDGVFEAVEFPGGAFLRQPVCVLQLPHRDGNKWKTKTSVFNMTRTETRTAHGPEKVEVPSGHYDAIRVESEYTHDGGQAKRQTQWYADGIGLVKWVVRDEVWVLTKFTPGKK